MKKLWSLVLAGLMCMSLVACSNGNEKKASENTELEETLVIYSTHAEDMLEFVATEFTAATGVEVEYINLKGELADRIREEKENPKADIMFGGASSLFTEMAGEGIFEPIETTWASELDTMFKAADGSWYGTIKTPVMMFYNKEMLSAEQAPKDWFDLAKPEYKDMIVSRDSVSSSIRATLMSLIYNYEKDGKVDEAWTFLESLDSNIKNYYNSGTMQFQAVGKKEAAISFAVQSSIIDNIEDNQMPLEIVDAESGSIVITDAVAAIKNAPSPNAAKAFIEFIGSATMQTKVANEFNRIPTLNSALEGCPEWMKTEYKAMDVDWTIISQKQSEWLQKWDTEIRDADKDIKES